MRGGGRGLFLSVEARPRAWRLFAPGTPLGKREGGAKRKGFILRLGGFFMTGETSFERGSHRGFNKGEEEKGMEGRDRERGG